MSRNRSSEKTPSEQDLGAPGISNSLRIFRIESLRLSNRVALVPARANKNAQTAPTGPAPEIIMLGDVELGIAAQSFAVACRSVLQGVEKVKSSARRVA